LLATATQVRLTPARTLSPFTQQLRASVFLPAYKTTGALPVFSSFLYDESAYTGQKLHQKFHYIESIAISTLHSH
jgi:hypothetical protein